LAIFGRACSYFGEWIRFLILALEALQIGTISALRWTNIRASRCKSSLKYVHFRIES